MDDPPLHKNYLATTSGELAEEKEKGDRKILDLSLFLPRVSRLRLLSRVMRVERRED